MRASLCALVCLAGVGADDAGIGTLQLVDQSAFPRAACLDGSPPAFYFRPATTDAGRSKFLLYHEGGDFCGYGDTWEEWIEDCRQRAHTPLGSSRHLAANSTSDLSRAAGKVALTTAEITEAAAKGGPGAPSEADRIKAVTELVKLKQKEKRAARRLSQSPKKKKTKEAIKRKQ